MTEYRRAICDSCKEEFTGTVYFLQVWAEDVNGGVTLEAAAQNVKTRMENLAGGKCYCSKCMARIREQFNF